MKMIAMTFAAALVASAASASPLLPGGSVSPIPVYANTLNAATLVSATNTSNFASPGGLYTGTLYSQVFTNCVDNPYGLSALSFVYILVNDTTSVNSLGRFTVNGFGSYLTDSGSDPFSSPTQTDAFESTRQSDGDSLGWSFINAGPYSRMNPGAISRYFVVHTNATTYSLNAASVIDGDIATATAWAPVPTPGAGALLGLGTLAAMRRRR